MTGASARREREFGVSVGTVLVLLAALAAWRGHATPAAILGSVGAVLVVCGRFAPKFLRVPSAGWWMLAGALGWVNARILLSALFVALVTPMALAMRLAGRDALRIRRRGSGGWSAYPERLRSPKHYERMY